MDRTSAGNAIVAELLAPRQLVMSRKPLNLDAMQEDDVFAKTLYSSISPGTEVAAYRGDPPLRPTSRVYPRLVGYCNVAEVVSVGAGVSTVSVGDRILTCESHRSAFVCKERSIVAKLPEGCAPAEASTAYLFQLGYNALLKGGFFPGMNVALIGLGVIGFATLSLVRLFGSKVFVFADRPAVSELALCAGAAGVFRKDDPEAQSRILSETGGIGIDIVVSTSNSWADWQLALRAARKGGTISVLGFPGRSGERPGENPLDSQYFYDKQLRLVSSGQSSELDVEPHDVRFTVQRNCRYLLDCIGTRRLSVETLGVSIDDWSTLDNVYQEIDARRSGSLFRILRWNGQ